MKFVYLHGNKNQLDGLLSACQINILLNAM